MIDRPVPDVFAYVTDIRNVPDWQESALSAEWLEEGRLFRERRHFMGRNADLELEVTALEPERRFDFRAAQGPGSFEIRHRFEGGNSGTRGRGPRKAELRGAPPPPARGGRGPAAHPLPPPPPPTQ